MFRLNNVNAKTMTAEEQRSYNRLLDCLISNENVELKEEGEKSLPEEGEELSPLMESMFRDREKISASPKLIIMALKSLITRVNERWDCNKKAKLITAIVNTHNEALISFEPDQRVVTVESQRLAETFQDNILKRNRAQTIHRQLQSRSRE